VLHFGSLSRGAEAFPASKKNPITWSANARLAAMRGPFTLIDVMSKVCPGPDLCQCVTPGQNIIFFDPPISRRPVLATLGGCCSSPARSRSEPCPGQIARFGIGNSEAALWLRYPSPIQKTAGNG